MLKHLHIQNYTLIKKLDLDFEQGFSVITGETGAGKSIIIGALGLILGKRADSSVLFDKDSKCIIEGTFYIKGYGLEEFFSENELDYDDETVIRREIGVNGKSRAFINDTPVNLSALDDLSKFLVDIHSQHETLILNTSQFQIQVLDSYASLISKVANFKKKYFEMRNIEKALNKKIDEYTNNKSDINYYQFQYDELDKANLVIGEQEDSESELDVLNHAEEIKITLNQINLVLSLNEDNIVNQLTQIESKLAKTSTVHQKLEELRERIKSTIIELDDVSSESEKLDNEIEYSPERTNELNERLDLIYKLEQKHKVSTIEELLDVKRNLEEQISSIETSENDIERLRKELDESKSSIYKLAEELSKHRKSAIPKIENKIKENLFKLGMDKAIFKIEQQMLDEPNEYGKDKIKFLFNANLGLEPKELSKVASGGELSRLMLSIKSIISQRSLLPTIVFDEIDMGVSGEIAGKMGDILDEISRKMQVLAITHLPQIAGKAKHHFKVFKETDNNTTRSRIRKLSNEERVKEIAKILSGNEVSEAAIKTAEELLKLN